MTVKNPGQTPNKKKGRAPFCADDAKRALVAARAAQREPHAEIARLVGISVPTLRKHFAAELSARLEPDNLFTATGAPPPAAHPAPPRPPRAPRADGRKRWQPSQQNRDDARLLIAAGTPHAVIAARLGISPPTFARAFRDEIANAYHTERAAILMDMRRTARRGNVAAQKALAEILDRAELERIENDVMRPKEEKPPKPLGKKEQADLDAESVMDDPIWGNLLPADADTPPLKFDA